MFDTFPMRGVHETNEAWMFRCIEWFKNKIDEYERDFDFRMRYLDDRINRVENELMSDTVVPAVFRLPKEE